MKILWQELKKECVPYNKEVHGKGYLNFLYWNSAEGEVLLVGPRDSSDGVMTHKMMRNASRDYVPTENPIGAGLAAGKTIFDWDSAGFDVQTPKDIRNKIAEALEFKIK